MAIRFAIVNTATNTVLAQREIPDTALPKIQQTFPGTPQQTAGQVLDYVIPFLRDRVRENAVDQRRAIDQQTVQTGETQERTTFETAWPEA
jgi:hypothetical protein